MRKSNSRNKRQGSALSRVFLLSGLVVAFSLTGCAGIKNTMRLSSKDSAWNPVSKLRAEKEKKAEPSEPVNMVCTWKGSIYENTGTPSIRGFGGRIFFYDKDNNSVEADGELVIYGFDEANKDRETDKADKKFVFRSSDFQKHKSESGFGTSYSVWVPWERMGGFRKTITLVPMFVTADKRIIKGGQSINVLHGKAPSSKQLSENKPYKVLGSSPAVVTADYSNTNDYAEQVAQTAFAGEPEEASKRIKTSTINLTPNMADRIAQSTGVPSKDKRKSAISTTADAVKNAQARLRSQLEARNATQTSAEVNSPQPKRTVFGAPGSFN